MKKSRIRIQGSILVSGFWICLSACAPRPAMIKSGFNFSQVRRLAVAKFDGESGVIVSAAFVHALTVNGMNIVDRTRADGVIVGTVTDYQPGRKLMVFLGPTKTVTASGQTLDISNPIVFPGSTQVLPPSPTSGVENAQIASVSASVGVIVRLMDISTGHVVWSDEYSYESLDLPGALQAVVSTLSAPLQRALPNAQRRPSATQKASS